MLGQFTFWNPTKLHFGEGAIASLKEELDQYGDNVVLIYGGGSIKKNGIYDQVVEILKEAGKNVAEIAGVMPNPTRQKLYEGMEIARAHQADLLLPVGGGSCFDYTKALAVSIHCEEDPWQKYYLDDEEPTCEVVPLGGVLTMVGTGSEMNGGAVLTDHEAKFKVGKVFVDRRVFPKFAILDPVYTMTLPEYQMVAGIYDIFNHICEQYFSGEDDSTTDYLAEGLMRSVVHSSRIAKKDPKDYEARSNLMWSASWALNRLLTCGKTTDWEVHMLGHAISAVTDATHGMTLAAVSLPYYRMIMPHALPKFARFAVNVWGVNPEGKSEEALAEEGLAAMEAWMQEIGLVMHSAELGVTEENLPEVVKATVILDGGYKKLSTEEVEQIQRASM